MAAGRKGSEKRLSLRSDSVAGAACGSAGSPQRCCLLWHDKHNLTLQLIFTVVIVGLWLALAFALRQRVVFPLQTLSNILARSAKVTTPCGREGRRRVTRWENCSVRRYAGETLRDQRLGALEATNLLRKIMAEIDVAVLAFDA